MKHANSLVVPFISLLLVAGCATSTHSDSETADSETAESETGCPPGQTRIEDENTDMYDCASREDYEDMRDVMDEQNR